MKRAAQLQKQECSVLGGLLRQLPHSWVWLVALSLSGCGLGHGFDLPSSDAGDGVGTDIPSQPDGSISGGGGSSNGHPPCPTQALSRLEALGGMGGTLSEDKVGLSSDKTEISSDSPELPMETPPCVYIAR